MKENTFKKGIVAGLPICFGYFAVSFAFGIFAVNSGLSITEAVLISATNLTSAGQLAAVPIITSGGSMIELAVSQLVINSRYGLMSISLSQKFDDKVTFADKFWIAFSNTDEIFAVNSSQKQPLSKQFMFGLSVMPFIGWTGGTLVGAIAGDVLPEVISNSLQIAIYGMFIAIVVPVAKSDHNTFLCVILSLVLSLAFYYLPVLKEISSGFRIVIVAIIACAIMAYLKPIEVNEDE